MYATILAGGSGSRLWPLSRESHPKYYLKVKQGQKDSLIEGTVKRLKGVVKKNNIFIVTNKSQASSIDKIFKGEIGILGEPCAKNTAPAIGLAAWYFSKKDPNEIMFVFPSDHYIESVEKFKKLLLKASKVAKKYGLVTFGIKPDSPETGYGYILSGEEITAGVFKVQKFVEKPNINKAKKFIKDKRYLWNSGMFVFHIQALIEEFRKYLPEIANILDKVDYEKFSNLKKLYEKMGSISIDYGIMEKSKKTTVIPTNITWSDVGTWDSFYKINKKDKQGNCLQGNVLALNSENSLVLSSNRLVGVLGIKDLVIVDTDDALLVCDKSSTQDVKKLFDEIKGRGMKEF